MKNLTHLHGKKVKLYSLFILNKIWLKLLLFNFKWKNYEDVNIFIIRPELNLIYIIWIEFVKCFYKTKTKKRTLKTIYPNKFILFIYLFILKKLLKHPYFYKTLKNCFLFFNLKIVSKNMAKRA